MDMRYSRGIIQVFCGADMQRGFSLVEILIVITVLMILVGALIINIPQNLARFEVHSTAQVLAADIRWLQQVTINSANSEEQVVLIPQLVMRQTAPYGYIVVKSSAIIRSYEFPAGVVTAGNERYLSFTTNGRPAAGSQLTFTLISTRDKSISAKVIVEMITGRVRIE